MCIHRMDNSTAEWMPKTTSGKVVEGLVFQEKLSADIEKTEADGRDQELAFEEADEIKENDEDGFDENEEQVEGNAETINYSGSLGDSRNLPLAKARLKWIGKRLFKDPFDVHAMHEDAKAIVTTFNFAKKHGDKHFEKYIPLDKKGMKKDITFRSTFYCKTPKRLEKMIRMHVEENSSKSHMSGLQSCSKTYACPICGMEAEAIEEMKINELLKAADSKDMTTLLLTLTVPHARKTIFHKLLDNVCYTFSKPFCKTEGWKNSQEHYAYVGHIRGLETTLGGRNGSHAHLHIILIYDSPHISDDELETLRSDFLAAWEDACITTGLLDNSKEKLLEDFRANAVNLKREFSTGYIVKQAEAWKWEFGTFAGLPIESEMLAKMKEHGWDLSKCKSDKGGLSPFGFLKRMAYKAAFTEYSMQELSRDIDTFVEYICAMHKKRPIQYSDGLFKKLGIEKKNNRELIKNVRQAKGKSKIICGFDHKQYKTICEQVAMKPVKKAIEKKGVEAIGVISEWFIENGLFPVYTAKEAQLYKDGQDGIWDMDKSDRRDYMNLVKQLNSVDNAARYDEEGEYIRGVGVGIEVAETTAKKGLADLLDDFLAADTIGGGSSGSPPRWAEGVKERQRGTPLPPDAGGEAFMGGVFPAARPIPTGVGG